jgi:hypothetical protein
MKSRTLLAPVLLAFGMILGAPALGDDPSTNVAATDAPIIDVAIVNAPSDGMTLCVSLDNTAVPLPCVISADDATLACVTLKPGDNFIPVPYVAPEILAVCAFPENPGVN